MGTMTMESSILTPVVLATGVVTGISTVRRSFRLSMARNSVISLTSSRNCFGLVLMSRISVTRCLTSGCVRTVCMMVYYIIYPGRWF